VSQVKVGQQIPAFGFGRPVLPQPFALGVCHRVVTKRVLSHEPGPAQRRLILSQSLRPFTIACLPREFPSQLNYKSKAVLTVFDLRIRDQPVPVHVNVGAGQPRKGFHDACIEIRLVQSVEEQLRGIPPWPTAQVAEPRIT
jgi:hypothetical protein